METENISGFEIAEELITSANRMKDFATQSLYCCYQIFEIVTEMNNSLKQLINSLKHLCFIFEME
jgi:hypothetical protein